MYEEENEVFSDSDNELDEKQHSRLLEDLVSLDSKQPVKKPSRSEPTLEISEYNLVKSIAGSKDAVRLHELTKPLKARAAHVEISKKVKKADAKTKTLQKPLEKVEADRIRRTVAYEKTKVELDKWEPVVTSNRVATHLTFPLNYDSKIEKDDKGKFEFRIKTDLQKRLEEVEQQNVETYEIETVDQAPLSLQEMIERRNELMKLRRYQMYKEQKARMQNKIKSRTYRRILRKSKAKEAMREFEILQKTDPEAALQKLEEIERTRALERFSLRHKSTGSWARNKQIRAKYDNESRQELAQQLAISRELTQKQTVESSDSEEHDQEEPAKDDDTVWPRSEIVQEKEITDFLGGYRKYWENIQGKNGNKETSKENLVAEGKHEELEENKDLETWKKLWKEEMEKTNIPEEDKATSEDKIDHKQVQKSTNRKRSSNGILKEKQPNSSIIQNEQKTLQPKKRKQSKTRKIKVTGCSGDWEIDDDFIDNLANKLEDKIKNKATKRANKLKKDINYNKNKKTHTLNKINPRDNKPAFMDLSLKKQIKRPIIDEELDEVSDKNKVHATKKQNKYQETLQSILKSTVPTKPMIEEPTKYNSKPIQLNTQTPDVITTVEDDVQYKKGLEEAFFEDDLIENDFAEEKQDEIEKNTPKNINLCLPGWGSWTGKNIKVSQKKKNRFILKVPKDLPRKDKNRGHLIINEEPSKDTRKHMVCEVPFPFKSVKDYEASIRAPIGKTFVPETAFSRLTRPAVTTKLGTVIEPMGEGVLMHKLKKNVKKIENKLKMICT